MSLEANFRKALAGISDPSPGLPVWTYAESGPETGQFTADGSPAALNNLTFHLQPKNGGGGWHDFWTYFDIGNRIILTDSTGKSLVYAVTSAAPDGELPIIVLGIYKLSTTDDGVFSGDYQISWMPFQQIDRALSNSGITPVADGTYTMGLGGTQNGTITIVKGIITAAQEAIE